MTNTSEQTFKIDSIKLPYAGVTAYRVLFESATAPDPEIGPEDWREPTGRVLMRRAFGRAVVLDTSVVELRIYPFQELIHRSWMPGTPNFVRFAPTINLGTKLSEFIYDEGEPELKDMAKYDLARGNRVASELEACFFACNTLQTNFVRSNGFVIAPKPGETPDCPILWHKPERAFGLYDRQYIPLGPIERAGTALQSRQQANLTTSFDGQYDSIVFDKESQVCQLSIEEIEAKSLSQNLPMLAICSPIILYDGVPIRPCDIPYCPNDIDQTIDNEVNWDPTKTCSSFTAFGVCENRQQIVSVSMFESIRGRGPARNRGITASEMGWLLSKLGATEGIIGGGGADTQQFLDADSNDLPMLLEAAPRYKRPDEGGAAEVQGARGLGAILAALQ